MCFYNSMSKKAKELAARYGRKTDIIETLHEVIDEQEKINAFKHPLCAIVTGDEEIQAFNWGLIPYWVKNSDQAKDMAKMTLNAKAETIFEKPSFRQPILSKRCLVPSTGFYEWRHEDKNKIPYFIWLKDTDIFSLAGIYEVWNSPEGKSVHTFSVITTVANPLMEYIHNSKKRMPVILLPEDEEKWLSPTLKKPDISDLMNPVDENLMEAKILEKA